MNDPIAVLYVFIISVVVLALVIGADFLERYMSGALFSETVLEETIFFPKRIIVGRHARSTEMDDLDDILDAFMLMTDAQKDDYCKPFLSANIIVPVVN